MNNDIEKVINESLTQSLANLSANRDFQNFCAISMHRVLEESALVPGNDQQTGYKLGQQELIRNLVNNVDALTEFTFITKCKLILRGYFNE